MMGKDHAKLGAIAGLVVLPFIHGHGLPPLTPARLAVGAALTAGAALLPDLDHPHASAGYTFGWCGRRIAAAICRVSGGHRHATHSALGVAVLGAAAWWGCGRGTAARWIMLFVLIALELHVLLTHRHYRSLILAACATAALVRYLPMGRWSAVAVMVGCACHVAGDMLNPERCPLLWPWGRRFGVGVFSTKADGTGEHVASVVMLLALIVLAWARLGPAATAAVRA